ncbi:YbaY family lipoprotein [Tropicimonas sp.]|uniref:YbaY family lipoprotein n=1 Tax=Tropicimonas sp. TaxID=2067044 RepID=UPI003A8AE609
MRPYTLCILILAVTSRIAGADTVTGTVTYLERTMPPPGATVEIILSDISLADAPARTIAGQTLPAAGAPPYAFAIEYDPATIDQRHTYGLRATMRAGGRITMTTDTAYPVLTRGAGNMEDLILKQVSVPAPDADLVNTYWKVRSLGALRLSPPANGREAHLILRGDGSYNATAGCNMVRGTYSLDNASLRFEAGAATRKACIPPLDLYEGMLLRTLADTAGFRISGETLELHDAAGAVLASFAAVYF